MLVQLKAISAVGLACCCYKDSKHQVRTASRVQEALFAQRELVSQGKTGCMYLAVDSVHLLCCREEMSGRAGTSENIEHLVLHQRYTISADFAMLDERRGIL